MVSLLLHMRHQKGVRPFLGLSSLVFVTLCYLFFDLIKGLIPDPAADAVFMTIKSLWWISIAYVVNSFLKWGVYHRRLTLDGDSAITLLIQHLIAALIYLLAAMAILRFVFDQSITAVATASGAVALLLGYSSRTVLEEVFSGLALMTSEPFQKGELIEIGGEYGFVKDITWRSITYIDMDENSVVLPNTIVASSKIRNLDRPSKMVRRVMFFTAEYNIPPKVVIEETDAAIKECPHIASHPWNSVVFYSFEKTGTQYKVHFYISHYNDWYVASDELVSAMWYRFARKGIRFAHQRHLNYTTEEDEKKGLSKSAYDNASWKELFEEFSHIPIFEGMTDTDMEELVKSAPFHVMGPPELITRAGAQHSSMFLLVSGAVDLYEVDTDGSETWMKECRAYDHFGLMSLLTGEPQLTTIRAKEETVICELTSETLHEFFECRPEIMKKTAENVVRRQQEENIAVNAIAESRQIRHVQAKAQAKSLSDRIIKFFDLRVG